MKKEQKKMIYQNFFVKAKVGILSVPIEHSDFIKTDEEGNLIEGNFNTIPEYLAEFGHTVKRFSSDGYFIKGFGFNLDGVKELETKLASYGLTLGVDIWILSPREVQEELAKEEWNNESII